MKGIDFTQPPFEVVGRKSMIEIIRNSTSVKKSKVGEVLNLHQLQIDGLRKGWLIYPKTLKPLILTIRKREARVLDS